tara:strand:- start:312 stop:2963 length:2652 start_codon:yes stop_codon:yes gene_type:complete
LPTPQQIFGFESFKVNSFEQLCINYANERLQQQFNWDVFKSEQAEYEREGIEWKHIDFVDNQECLDLIDNKAQLGIIHLLDEECSVQQGTDDKFVQKLREKHKAHPYFEAPKRDQSSFIVKHYAGNVTYTVVGFREKNKDTLHADLTTVMQQSQSAFVRTLFAEEAAAQQVKGGARGGSKKSASATVGAQFMTQLASLMRTINSTGVHYVRCIKPNTSNVAKKFETVHVAHQLRCAGVLEAIRVSRMAYPNRMPHSAFLRRYALLSPPAWLASHQAALSECRTAPPGDAGVCKTCSSLLELTIEDTKRYQLGKTKVFFRAFMLEGLEQQRGAALATRAILLQKNMRMCVHRRRFLQARAAAIMLQKQQRRHYARMLFTRRRRAAIRMQAAVRGRQARVLARFRRAAVRIQKAARARLARLLVTQMRRDARATTIQAVTRRRAKRQRFLQYRRAALRLQSHRRMVVQRRQYIKDLAEKKDEAKLSTQLARLQAQMQAEIDARKKAEETAARAQAEVQAKIAAGIEDGKAAAAVPAAAAAAAAGETSEEASGAAALLQGIDAATGMGISGKIAGAASYLGYGGKPQSTAAMEETSAMLAQVTKDREKLSQKLAAETELRKKFEAQNREYERKVRLTSATSQLETRKTKDISDTLSRRKEEIAEMRQMMQHQTIEISNLQAEKEKLEKRSLQLEKKLSQYDDSFYSLEARNVRDRTRMEEMGKAKNKAEEEKNVYKHMLEQAHERWLRERQELFRDALNKVENNAARVREQQTRIAQLEKQLRNQAQLEEEVKMYKEQARALTEQLTATAGSPRGSRPTTPRATTPRAVAQPDAPSPAPTADYGGSLMSRMSKHASNLAAKGGSMLNDLSAGAAAPTAAETRHDQE